MWPDKVQDEPKSVKLGLAIDGVNPYSIKLYNYLVWHVIIINYNIHPCMSLKNKYLILTLLVPIPHQVKNMDIYLEPLIDELQQLWNGIHNMIDISRPIQQRSFILYGILCWTIHDYPGLSIYSGMYI